MLPVHHIGIGEFNTEIKKNTISTLKFLTVTCYRKYCVAK